jgi:hypothetical protein
MSQRFTVALLGSAAFLIAFLVVFSLLKNGPPSWSPSEAPAQAKEPTVDRITDPVTVQAFNELIIKQGFNCPSVISLIRNKMQTERGQPFQVACSGRPGGLFYRVTVQPRGTAIVEAN